ncbi:UNVERIFIED_ORG: hypothetical protein J2Y81_001944 [Paraburkholderia sediminicola]|nr:hypothetical protein [Paraburkholderia sediminicola]
MFFSVTTVTLSQAHADEASPGSLVVTFSSRPPQNPGSVDVLGAHSAFDAKANGRV